MRLDVHVKAVKSISIGIRENLSDVDSVCDEIFSEDAKPAHAIIFLKFPKSLIKIQFSTINNKNFENLSRVPYK